MSRTDNYIIAIGASAGGLDPINEFFDNMPANTGLSFVIIQHLSPDHKSMMLEILSKHTSMPVYEATEDMVIQPDSVYLIPSRKILSIKDGRLHLHPKQREQHPLAIDTFMESLALEKRNKAVGVILSGTGTDGTRGIEAIKQEGGTVVVQDPLTAEFNGMPNSAIATGAADLILSPELMPYEIIEFLKEAPLLKAFNNANQQEEEVVGDILSLILRETGRDFSYYKRPTLNRRIARRMAEKGIPKLRDYLHYLEQHRDEVLELCTTFLINVTAFFRDKEAFDLVARKVVPALFARKGAGETIKIWVVACSSGEEAYSIAMLFEEYRMKHAIRDVPVKLFATDLDAAAIDAASKGIYSTEAVSGISPERLERFFVKEGNQYRVTPSLRRMIVFAQHDITKDPPYSKVDFLSCRNMLIYMNPVLQRSILAKFHFSLVENGFLFMGPSENIGVLKDAMLETDRKWKLFQCVSKAKLGIADTYLNPVSKGSVYSSVSNSRPKNPMNNLPEIFSETVFEEFNYAGIIIDADFEVKQAIGNFKRFIHLPDNRLNFNLLKMVPNDLSILLSSSVRKAIKNNEKVTHKKVKLAEDGKERLVSVVIKPYLNQKSYSTPFIFIVLNELEAETRLYELHKHERNRQISPDLLEELENELRDTKESLQAVIEEVETSNEELQSSNEEIISANEELQSTNEELQSLNEELHTVNAEHQLKIRELIELNEDLNNYFNNSDIGQILVDRNMIIRRFTPIATRQVNLIESDIGRSITDISNNFKSNDFLNLIKKVMKSGIKISQEMTMHDDQVFLMRIAPFLKMDNTIDGVVISFVDITEIKKVTGILDAVFNSSISGINVKRAIRNEHGRVIDFEYVTMNATAEKTVGKKKEEIIGRRMLELYPEMNPEYVDIYRDVVETGENRTFEFFNPATGRWFDVSCVKLMDGIVTTFTDMTHKKEAAALLEKGYADLKDTTHQLEKTNLDLMQFASVASHDLKEPLRKIHAFGDLLRSKAGDKLEDNEYNYLNKIIAASGRMQTLVDDILTLSKLSNDGLPHSEVALNELIAQILEDLEITIREKKASIEVGRLPVIRAFPGHIHQLFLNLIVNALKFNKNNRPVVKIYEEDLNDELFDSFAIEFPEKYAGIIVEDNGIGFNQVYGEKIFGIFQRLGGAQYKGTGIGLAICKKIVENHDGFIKAYGIEGKGAKFILALPR